MTRSKPFRVVIAGGGIAGLTLASALEQGGIDYVLLERQPEFAPQVGASIGVYPNASRILDQLGAWEKVQNATERIEKSCHRDKKGIMVGGKPGRPNALHKTRTGYEITWGERQTLLKILFENIQDKSKLLAKKDVVDIRHFSDGVTVLCKDGSSYVGDILVGADGVGSKTREKMWQLAEPEMPDLVKRDRNALFADHNCLFGIATGVDDQFKPGDIDISCDYGRCLGSIFAKGNKYFYFLQAKLDKPYRSGNFPRYTAEETEAFVSKFSDAIVRPGFRFGDLLKNTVSHRLVTVEEGVFKIWTWGRVVCLGDSIHKSTPDLGAGGNAAIESAASLANAIKRVIDAASGARISENDVRRTLQAYQEERQLRADAVVEASGRLTRLHNLNSLADRVFFKYGLAHTHDFIDGLLGDMMIGATKIDYLPLPMKSLVGTQPFNPSQGEGKKESRMMRALLSLPLLCVTFIAFFILNVSPALPWAEELLQHGTITSGPYLGKETVVPLRYTLSNIKWLDDLLALLNTFFMPSIYDYDPPSRRQAVSFLSDGAVILTINMIESVRRANVLTIMQIPALFTLLGQVLGFGVVAPLYCWFYYVFSPIENYSATDQRLTKMKYTPGALLSVLVGATLPTYAMYFWPDLETRQVWLSIWQLYPFWISATMYLLSRCFPDTTEEDKGKAPNRDLPVIRLQLGAVILLAAAWWTWCWAGGPYSMAEIFIPTALPSSMTDLTSFTRVFLQFDEIFVFGAELLWLGYLFWDLKAAGMVDTSWLVLIPSTAVSVVALGPGATLGLGWLWREHILAYKKHKNALTDKSVARLGGKVETINGSVAAKKVL